MRTIIRAIAAILFLVNSSVVFAQKKVDPEDQLKKLGIELPTPSKPVANYVKYVRTGNLIFLSGHGPCNLEGIPKGQLGDELTIEQGYAAARQAGICLIATLKDAVDGDLNKVVRIVRVFGLVSSTDTFTDQPKVMNGCSDLMVEVFGDKGKHVRAAVGTNVLPFNIPVEIEMVVEVK
jgi:enamine deaminase RidA (YjgF/YER057c/UK114 family)